jgi:5'-deoxynucleotidase YfbR-like HD superfamily hydrolase
MKNKKTMHELAKEFPEKTYRELEKYRDADRQEEAQRIITQQENEELTESQQKQEELEPIEGVNWEEIYKKEHELRKKAEKELEDLKKKIDPLEKMRRDGL